MQLEPCMHDSTRNIMLKYVFNNISSEDLWASLQYASNFRTTLRKVETSATCISSYIQCTVATHIDLNFIEFTILSVKKLSHARLCYAFVEMKSVRRKFLTVIVWTYPSLFSPCHLIPRLERTLLSPAITIQAKIIVSSAHDWSKI